MVCEQSETTLPPPEVGEFTAAAESFPSSAESSFRELDDAFLQTQTRIWLGEVLQIRLDEQLIISELLADGELLFQVSKVVWKLLLAKHKELRHIKAYKSLPFSSKKNSGRYRPYSNVDSFLKICKILGLTGIDLFSPSDVVERRNTRRVCMCIRSFSKKTRSKNINVPDFDIVTCMLAMPKDMVGCIRRNLELSYRSLADSSSLYLQKRAGGKSRQVYLVTDSTRDYETYSEQSEDTEIKYPVLQFDGLHTDHLYDCASEINYSVPSPMVKSVLVSEDLDQWDIQNQQRNEISENDFELLCSMESLQYHCSENIDHDCKLTWSSSSCGDLHIGFSGMASHLDTRFQQIQDSRIRDFDYFEHEFLRNNPSVIANPTNDKTPVTRDASSHANDRKDPDLFHEENGTPKVHQSASSHGSNSTPRTIENGRRCFEIGDKVEVLHVAGMSCLSREALNLGDQFDAEKKSFKMQNDKNDQWNSIKGEHESQAMVKYKEMAYGITSNARYSYFVKEFEETVHSLYSPDGYFCKTNSSDRALSHSDDFSLTQLKKFLAYEDRKSRIDLDNASCNQSEELPSCLSYSLPEFCKWDQKGKCVTTSYSAKDNTSSSCFLEDGFHELTTPCKQEASEVLMSCVPKEDEDVVSAGIVKLDTDGKYYCQALASNVLGVDDCEKCPTIGDDANDFCDTGVTTEDIRDRSKRVDMTTHDVLLAANSDEDVSHTGSSLANQSSKLECNGDHQACQYNTDPVYHSEHTCKVHDEEETKQENKNVHSFEILVETEEGSIEKENGKPQKKLLLKSVLGGAAAFGLLFTFLHFRRNGEEKAAQSSKASSHKGKEKIQKYSPRKVRRRSRTEGVYPAEKLKLK